MTGTVATARGPSCAGDPRTTSAADPRSVQRALERISGGEVEVIETHISWLFLTHDRAYKLKKPVVLDFLDYGTPARRRAMCRAEVTLNARLAPEIYLGVLGLATVDGELELVSEDDPRAVDYVVRMRRFDERATLAAAVQREPVAAESLELIGRRLAAFHRRCPPSKREGGADRARAQLDANLAELRRVAGARLDERLDELARFADAFITSRRRVLDARCRNGHVREGHGDLRAEHVLLEPEVSVIDCVEFDSELRTLDTADDVGFLVMDLLAHGSEPTARAVLAAYRRVGGDCGDDPLVWLFAMHRALVRAKVALVRAAQSGADRPRDADSHIDVADACAWRARAIDVLVVCGGPATGKSLLAGSLGSRWSAPVLSTDVLRKELAGLASHDRAPSTAYSPQMNERTYRSLGQRAREMSASGTGVIVDGTFRHRADRAAFASGLGDHRRAIYVQCVVAPEVAIRRAAERERDPGRISDATADFVRTEGARIEAITELDAEDHLVLRTDRRPAAIERDLLALLDGRLSADGR